MTTLHLTAYLLLTATALFATTQHPTDLATQSIANTDSVIGRVVTIVKSKAPWYAADFLVDRAFRKAIPTYKKLDGLRFKAFSSIKTSSGKFVGGIYLWDSDAQARRWFTPDWFADIERKRGHKPTVDYFPLINAQSFVASDSDYRKSGGVTIFIHGIDSALTQQCLTKQPGLLRTYIVAEANQQSGTLLLFSTVGYANTFLAEHPGRQSDWFETSVLLDNTQNSERP
ncbi:MAG: hypothetical protein H7319_23605 [Spirosoma sp.]|nr:hypothetical protein [Spirosoma sp.]